jgi:hypothetical protein
MNKKLIVLLFLIVVILLSLALRNVFQRVQAPQPPPPKPPVSQSLNVSGDEQDFAVLRHPLVPGGIKSVAELRMKIDRDPKLAEFYRQAGFEWLCATETVLDHNLWSRVSSRTDAGFAYSSRPMLILAGEKVLEDCNGMMIRVACANTLMPAEKTPEAPTDQFSELIQPLELAGSEFGAPVSTVPWPPAVYVPGIPEVPVLSGGPYPIPCCVGIVPIGGSSHVSTSEPSTWYFLATGLAVILVNQLIRKSEETK